MLWWVIIGCEVGFWVLLAGGLATRYWWKRRLLSTILLLAVPLVDVVLLGFAVWDMSNGAVASARHGIAAACIGYGVVFGHRTIRWVDRYAAHRLADGPAVYRPPKFGAKRVRYEAVYIAQYWAAYAVMWLVVWLCVWFVADASRTQPLIEFAGGLTNMVIIASVISMWSLIAALKKPTPAGVGSSDTATL